MYAIYIKNLNKSFESKKTKEKITALNNINLKIPQGSIFAILGLNGAGKSTLINILAGLTIKNSGSVKINGYDIDKNRKEASCQIGIVPQEINFDPFFTPKEILDVQSGLYGIRKKNRITEKILEDLDLLDKANAYSRSLSGGMKRRLMIAKALIHQPTVLVLDEPTAGVDVNLRRQLWKYIIKLNKMGTTILLTTHYIEEAEKLCDRISIINKGKLIIAETKVKIMNRFKKTKLEDIFIKLTKT